MSSYLRALFAEDNDLHFTASLAFEQSYGGIDGDSATVPKLAHCYRRYRNYRLIKVLR